MNIEIIAPSSAEPNKDDIIKAISISEKHNFKVNISEDLIDLAFKYESNTVDYRLKHLITSANNTNVDAIWALRGGYSSAKIANILASYPTTIAQTKFIVGFSDTTALFIALNQNHQWLCIHGACFIQLSDKYQNNHNNISLIFNIIKGEITKLEIPQLKRLNDVCPINSIAGKLVGGNLALIQNSVGTNWQINCAGKILFFEDVNEPAYKVDRMLTHLQQANILKDVKTVVIGNIHDPKWETQDNELMNYTLMQFAKNMEQYNCPVYKTESFGHYHDNIPIVIGADAKIKVSSDSEAILEYQWTPFI